MKYYNKGELAKNILKGLALGGFILACFALPGIAQVITLFKPKNRSDRYRVKQSLRQLKQKKYIRVYKKDGVDVVRITENGERKILAYKLADIQIQKKVWDKKWRIIIFDIPEKKKTARRALNKKLKDIGCYSLQKSVFVNPYPCKKEVDFICDYFGVRQYIIYIIALKIDNESKIKQHFNL